MTPIVSAIAAGNTIILKPSELTPHTSQIISEILGSIFEPEFISVVQGDANVAENLLKLPFDHIFFTGSTRVGKLVMKAASENLSTVTLELGGKSPTIIDASCDLAMAAQKIIWGKYLNNGQTCVAPDYILVEESCLDSLISQLRLQIKVQNRTLPENRCAMITPQHLQRIELLKKDFQVIDDLIIINPDLDSKLMQEEIFGPVLPIISIPKKKFND
jgi:aldehyde dehydrogenase (NAD+)